VGIEREGGGGEGCTGPVTRAGGRGGGALQGEQFTERAQHVEELIAVISNLAPFTKQTRPPLPYS
jgi:hypothetical protein